MATRYRFITRRTNHHRSERRIAATEFQQPAKRLGIELSGLDLQRPIPPATVKNGIDLQWLLAPVGHVLTLIDGERKAGVLDPKAEPVRLTSLIRGAGRVCGRQEGIVQHDNLRRGISSPVRLDRIFLDRSDEIGVL